MTYEVVVVGAGLGGLTAAALLAARGVSVCVVEKESHAGGCAAAFEKFGYRFEPTAGLYAGWGEGEIHARVFSELPVAPPEARRVSPAYVVRMANGAEVSVGVDGMAEFEAGLRAAFPECAEFAADFYRELARLADAQANLARRAREPRRAFAFRRWKASDEERTASQLLAAQSETAAQHLGGASPRFRRFLDAQLQLFALCPAETCAYAYAAAALTRAYRGMYALRGGADALAAALADSIRQSGGTLRFGATVLRLDFDESGAARGVVLLSGETVAASRAVVSNLTAWDTYGKLFGAARTPAGARAPLKRLRGPGAYLIFMGVDEEAAARLPSTRMIALAELQGGTGTDAREGAGFDPTRDLFSLNVAPSWDARAPVGKRAATIATFADAGEWFSYHEDEAEHEARDQATLEFWWGHLHAAFPELGAGAEVIETMSPRDYYERTRRRLGAVWGVERTPDAAGATGFSHRTHLPGVFMVGDTLDGGNGVEAVAQSALMVADEIAPPR